MAAAFAFTATEDDNMDLLLNRFGYLFSMEGKQGGLFSMEWHFLPVPGAGSDEAGVEAALRVHVDMLDRVFASVILGKRVESLPDSPGRGKVEYSYRGRLTLLGALLARRRLGILFGAAAARAVLHPVESGIAEASVAWHRDQSQDGSGGTGLNVTHRLGHAVNACLFRHLRAGGGFELSAEAERQTHALQNLLLELQQGNLPTDPWSPTGA